MDKKKRKRTPKSQPVPTLYDKLYGGENEGMSNEEIDQALAKLGGGPSRVAYGEDEERLAAPIGYVRKHGGLPATKKSLGQNWLTDPNVSKDIANSLHLSSDTLIVEVGPGGGALTEALLSETKAEILAIELDQRMVAVLNEKWTGEPRLNIVHADILKADLNELTEGRPFVLVGNLPYNISSSLMFKMMEHARTWPGKLKEFIVMLQLEVAERLCAEAGESQYSILSVFLRFWGKPQFLFKVDRKKFKPAPKVHSGVIRMEVAPQPLHPMPHWPTLKRLVKGTFGKRRKMLRNSVPGILNLKPMETVDFDWTRRPQTLTAEEFSFLADKLRPKNILDVED